MELEDPEAELEYIAQNRKNYYNTHSYMKDKAIGTAYDGPVFPDDIIYRRSSGEKYTVQADGSITTAAGRTYKAPDFQNFIHTFPKKGAAKKEAAPVLTLPKQDNPLIQGECKTRTPEEAKAESKAREQADASRVEKAMREIEEKAKAFTEAHKGESADEILAQMRGEGWNEEEKQTVREHYLGDYSDADLAEEMEHRDGLFGRLIVHALKKTTDKDLADELRRRGYTVNATKTVEI